MTNTPAQPNDALGDALLNSTPDTTAQPAAAAAAHQQPIVVNVSGPTAHPLPPKETGTAYLLWFFLGALGVHQFWLGNTGRGLLYLFTLGLFGVGLVIDLFTLGKQVRVVNARRAVGIA